MIRTNQAEIQESRKNLRKRPQELKASQFLAHLARNLARELRNCPGYKKEGKVHKSKTERS